MIRQTSSLRTMPNIPRFAGFFLSVAALRGWHPVPVESSWRLRYADLRIAIHLDRTIVGDVRLSLARSAPATIVLDFADSMAVDSVVGGGRRLRFERALATIRV